MKTRQRRVGDLLAEGDRTAIFGHWKTVVIGRKRKYVERLTAEDLKEAARERREDAQKWLDFAQQQFKRSMTEADEIERLASRLEGDEDVDRQVLVDFAAWLRKRGRS